MNAWSHLPNAPYIDRILESLKTHPDIWDAARDAGRSVSRAVAWSVAWDAARDAAWFAARAAARNAAWDAALYAARSAIAALIAWDDSAQFLEMNGDALEVWMRISDDPRAILLLPAVRVFERIKELETL